MRALCCAVAALAVAACAVPMRPAPGVQPAPPEPAARPATVAALAAAVQAAAARSDHESRAEVRGELAAEASRDAEDCLAREPQAAACLYSRAVALGLEARAHPTRAADLLKTMLDNLTRAAAADAYYDEAGPARVQALVLIRAPGWPLGPGDTEAGLAAARRAVALRPDYPPNLLALAEACAKTGDESGARDNYTRARDAALRLPAGADREEWLHQADQGLRRSP